MRNGIFALVFACGLGSAVLAGCDDDEPSTNRTDVGVIDAPSADAGAAGSGGMAGTGGTGGSAGVDGAVVDAADDAGAVVVDGPVAETGPTPDGPVTSGCFSGTPVTNLDFLNSCPPAGVQVVPDKVVTLPGGKKVGDPLPALQ